VGGFTPKVHSPLFRPAVRILSGCFEGILIHQMHIVVDTSSDDMASGFGLIQVQPAKGSRRLFLSF
jgi:hypothetical protein